MPGATAWFGLNKCNPKKDEVVYVCIIQCVSTHTHMHTQVPAFARVCVEVCRIVLKSRSSYIDSDLSKNAICVLLSEHTIVDAQLVLLKQKTINLLRLR